jgi:hypothetical protein
MENNSLLHYENLRKSAVLMLNIYVVHFVTTVV